MLFAAEITVLDDVGRLVEVDVPADATACWLCLGTRRVRSSEDHDARSTCPVCDGDGVTFAVAWELVDPEVKRGYDRIWQPHAWA